MMTELASSICSPSNEKYIVCSHVMETRPSINTQVDSDLSHKYEEKENYFLAISKTTCTIRSSNRGQHQASYYFLAISKTTQV